MAQFESLLKPAFCRLCLLNCNVTCYNIENCETLKDNLERLEMLAQVFGAISVPIFVNGEICGICESCDSQLLSVLQFLEMCKKSEECLRMENGCSNLSIKLENNEEDVPLSQLMEDSVRSASHISETLFCDFCGQEFSDKALLTHHLGTHLNKPISCFCGSQYPNKKRLRRHQSRVHAQRKYSCNQCGKTFRNKVTLNSHENIHSGTKPFLCSACPQRYYSYSGLSNHQLHHHSNTEKTAIKKGPRFLCENCGSSFGRKFHLHRHIRHVHTKNLPLVFSCKQCNKAFPDNDRLQAHQVTHKPRQRSCPECSKSFLRPHELRLHIARIHLQLRPHLCPNCPKTFKVKAHLTKHLRTHTGEKPHQCPLCIYKCAEKSNLRKHLRVHDRKS